MHLLINMDNGDRYEADVTDDELRTFEDAWSLALRRIGGSDILTLDVQVVDGAQQILTAVHLNAAAISSVGVAA